MFRYWLEEKPSLSMRYVKKSMRSPEKLLTVSEATNEYTVVSPLAPVYRLNEVSAMVVVATAEPVLEMGPAPPRAASQIIISNSLSPVDVEAVNKSYETSAAMFPLYSSEYSMVVGMDETLESCTASNWRAALANDLTLDDAPVHVQLVCHATVEPLLLSRPVH